MSRDSIFGALSLIRGVRHMEEPSPTLQRVLVVDDETDIRGVLSKILKANEFDVETAADGDEAIKLINDNVYDIVITDLKMPKVGGLEVLRHLAETGADTLGIIATGYGSMETAIEALRLGAFDYINKPFHLGEVRELMNRARDYRLAVSGENSVASRQDRSLGGATTNLIGESQAMRRLNEVIMTVADSDATVLILGDSGTGKELVARALHTHSPRKDHPLIPVNCGAIPEDLLESELFGHVKGSFTGASMDRIGRFQLAEGGTIFLDEIGDMSPKLQVKLLRVLQEREFEPVGSTRTVRCNVRVLAATHRNLEDRVKEGQ